MPIYEYLCPSCNRVFSFLAKSASSPRCPVCPKCGRKDLKKMLSKFSVTGSSRKSTSEQAPGTDVGDAADALDDPRVEGEMMRLMGEAESIDESDPRQLGRLMRRMSEITGENLGPEMEEAMRRLEAGEDPDKIEEDLGDVLDDGEGGGLGGGPSYDDGLYPM